MSLGSYNADMSTGAFYKHQRVNVLYNTYHFSP